MQTFRDYHLITPDGRSVVGGYRLKVTKFTGTCLQAVIGITHRLAVLVVGMVIMFARM